MQGGMAWHHGSAPSSLVKCRFRRAVQESTFSTQRRIVKHQLEIAGVGGDSGVPCYFSCIRTPQRFIVQSNSGRGIRSLLDQYADHELAKKLSRNGRGNYYRYQKKLWPSQEAIERDLTELKYSSVERMPLAMLPQRSVPRSICSYEGRGATMLLEQVERDCAQQIEGQAHVSTDMATQGGDDHSFADESRAHSLNEMSQMAAPVASKIVTEADLDGTVLASTRERAREIIREDLTVNTLADLNVGSAVGAALRVPPSAKDAAGASWEALGLDPLLSLAAEQRYGPTPTRLQTRLLPCLLNEDHNDVVFNGVTGSGKTSALVLSLLQGVRRESSGMNVLVANSTMTAMRLYDAIISLCRIQGGGNIVDRPMHDYSWLFLGTFREDYEQYYTKMRRSLQSSHGPVRLFITTADTMCQLLFEKKMEFEPFGYLRRVYVDDVGPQLAMLPETAPVAEARDRLRNPLAVELLLGTLHQMPGPHIRSILQLGLVSADLEGRAKDHLKALCLKLEAHTIVLSPVRIPSTIQCLFSFHLWNQSVYEYVVELIRNAYSTIPGRAILFVKDTEDMLQARRTLRSLGLNAKLFSEVYADGSFREKWKFVLLKESEAFGVDIPLVSHVFITFAPQSWQSFQHMCGRTGRLGNVGWVYTIADQRTVTHVRRVAEDVDVDFCHHVIQADLTQVEPADVKRRTKEPDLYGLDPQYAVRQHYEVQSENPDMAYRSREFFSRPAIKQFQREDYTPIPVQHRRFLHAKQLAHDVEKDPSIVVKMQKTGMLDSQLKPTASLRRAMDLKSSKCAPSPFSH